MQGQHPAVRRPGAVTGHPVPGGEWAPERFLTREGGWWPWCCSLAPAERRGNGGGGQGGWAPASDSRSSRAQAAARAGRRAPWRAAAGEPGLGLGWCPGHRPQAGSRRGPPQGRELVRVRLPGPPRPPRGRPPLSRATRVGGPPSSWPGGCLHGETPPAGAGVTGSSWPVLGGREARAPVGLGPPVPLAQMGSPRRGKEGLPECRMSACAENRTVALL